ncbi:prenyltransferase/squalene oxidase repeat-containing protein [Stella sp.]|uniref:prenyltransferase/squalene oxidase repeat-containing protein n=1 Tax=Stella sp. TaxID=2912054 RepID=UPI0035AE5821
MTEVGDAIARGLVALARRQRDDGSFPLLTGTRRQGWRPSSGLFSTAYVLLGAGRLLPPARIARAVAFVRAQRRADGLWEFDPALGLPPDSDSTSCALAALALHEGSAEPADAELLRGFWRPPEGPFRTWRAAGPWADPARDDPVVNCNLVLALDLLRQPATPVEREAVAGLLRRSTSGSRYYCAPAAIAHAAARAGFPASALPDVAAAPPAAGGARARAPRGGGGGRPGRRGGAAHPPAQRPDGAWPGGPWVFGVGTPYWGSSAVTTAFAIEALARHAGAAPWTAGPAVAMK